MIHVHIIRMDVMECYGCISLGGIGPVLRSVLSYYYYTSGVCMYGCMYVCMYVYVIITPFCGGAVGGTNE